MAAETIDQVIAELDQIIATCRRNGDRRGYFACLYRHVTASVKAALAAGEFTQGDVIEQLDVTFAGRYIDAFHAADAGRPLTAAWATSFACDRTVPPIVVQHLLCACNAHIDLDLGVAVATVVPADRLAAFKPDFLKINAILADQLTLLNAELCRIWTPYRLLLAVFGKVEAMIVNFGMDVARDLAWAFATELAALPPLARAQRVRERDAVVAAEGRLLWKPPLAVRAVLGLVRVGELHSVRAVIDAFLAVPLRQSPSSHTTQGAA